VRVSKLSNKKLEELAVRVGLNLDKETGILFGKKQGYDVCLRVLDSKYIFLEKNQKSIENLPQKNIQAYSLTYFTPDLLRSRPL